MVAAVSDDTVMVEKGDVELKEGGGGGGDEIDSDQLLEYQEMLEFLGNFADKVLINTLSMIAEDFANQPKSARAIYGCIRDFLVSSNTSIERKLPLVYVVDSILKNVNSGSSGDKRKNNPYVRIMEEDANEWLPIVYNSLLQSKENNNDGSSAARLKKVWYTWKEFGIFSQEIWEQMGQCFTNSNTTTTTTSNNNSTTNTIPKLSDGTLKVKPALRKEMQLILDEMQQDVEDELEKVSLERLAELNPELIHNIQQTAQDILDNKNSTKSSTLKDGMTTTTTTATTNHSTSSVFMEWRPPHVVERAAEWEKLMMGSSTHIGTTSSNNSITIPDQTSQLISKLHTTIRNSTSSTQIYSSHQEAIQQIQLLASVSVTASQLTTVLQKLKIQQNQHGQMPGVPANLYSTSVQTQFHRTHIDKSQFTTDGLKVKNESVIARLYDAGLPFVSSSDGRRFATQLLLSQHLDELFRQTQLEKSMERTDERGWYIPHWSSPHKQQTQSSNNNNNNNDDNMNENDSQTNNVNDVISKYLDPDACTVPADDSRDRCVICGMHFTMFFDQDDGEWKYSNCREISVENDHSKELLVHVKCWNSLGSPTHLPPDQVRQ